MFSGRIVMAALKIPRRSKIRAAAKPKKKPTPKASNRAGRKYLSPSMLDALIRHSPPHPAADVAGSNKPPFALQDD